MTVEGVIIRWRSHRSCRGRAGTVGVRRRCTREIWVTQSFSGAQTFGRVENQEALKEITGYHKSVLQPHTYVHEKTHLEEKPSELLAGMVFWGSEGIASE